VAEVVGRDVPLVGVPVVGVSVVGVPVVGGAVGIDEEDGGPVPVNPVSPAPADVARPDEPSCAPHPASDAPARQSPTAVVAVHRRRTCRCAGRRGLSLGSGCIRVSVSPGRQDVSATVQEAGRIRHHADGKLPLGAGAQISLGTAAAVPLSTLAPQRARHIRNRQ
jgi:hypothetical protein